jgi:hypothetical protein
MIVRARTRTRPPVVGREGVAVVAAAVDVHEKLRLLADQTRQPALQSGEDVSVVVEAGAVDGRGLLSQSLRGVCTWSSLKNGAEPFGNMQISEETETILRN